jgi:hypothetical protein
MDPVEAEMLWCLLSPHDWRPFKPLSTSAAKASIMWANGATQTGLIHGTTELALISMSILAQRSQSPFFFWDKKDMFCFVWVMLLSINVSFLLKYRPNVLT